MMGYQQVGTTCARGWWRLHPPGTRQLYKMRGSRDMTNSSIQPPPLGWQLSEPTVYIQCYECEVMHLPRQAHSRWGGKQSGRNVDKINYMVIHSILQDSVGTAETFMSTDSLTSAMFSYSLRFKVHLILCFVVFFKVFSLLCIFNLLWYLKKRTLIRLFNRPLT